jgi:Cohesin domain
MSKRTLVLVVILSVITVILIIIAVKPGNIATSPPPSVPSSTPTPPGHTLLILNPLANPQQKQGSVNVDVDPTVDTITGIQFTVKYDPTVLSNVAVTPKAYFATQTVLKSSVDPKSGLIEEIITIPPTGKPAQVKGTIATITYTINSNVNGNSTYLKFTDPTLVSAAGKKPNYLFHSVNAIILLKK